MSSLPASALPRCISLMAGVDGAHFFLYMGPEHAESEQGILTFGELPCYDALTPNTHTRFYLDPSKENDDEHAQLRHVRCAYNNKYWLPKEQDGRLVISTADEPQEDLSHPSCTLFKLSFQDPREDGKTKVKMYTVRFAHPRREKEVGTVSSSGVKNVNSRHLAFDVGEQIILPPYVAFKGDNGKLLMSYNDRLRSCFDSSDITDSSVVYTVSNYAHGVVRIKSKHGFLFVCNTAVWHDALPDIEISPAAVFKVVQFGDFFALQSMDNGNFFMRSSKEDVLLAAAENFTHNAKLQIEEPVLYREFYNVKYHISQQKRIYDSTNMNLARTTVRNRGIRDNIVKSSLTVSSKETSRWDRTGTHKVGGSTTVKFEAVPKLKILDIQAQVGYEYTNATTWGTSHEKDNIQSIEYTVTVPPKKKVTIVGIAKQAKLDVPYSYTQKDTMHSGEIRIHNYDDGLYTGMNCFNLDYETIEEELDDVPSDSEEKTATAAQ